MKKLASLFALFIALSCGDSKKEIINELPSNQELFITFIKNSCSNYKSKKNDILKREFIDSYTRNLLEISDGIGQFENWKVIVSEITEHEFGGVNYVDIELKVSDNITFKQSVMTPKEDDYKTSIFNKIKSLGTGDIVYVNGLFLKNKDGLMEISDNSLMYESIACDAEIKINITDISINKIEI